MFGNTGPFSYSPRGFSQDELPRQRKAFQQDDISGSLLQRNMSRPSGKSIYMQRKEYSEALNRQPDDFHFRVEHLFTCELDGQELKAVDCCVAKLKRLDVKGRLWPQEMILEAQGGYLLLSDIETRAALESLPLSSIQQTKAVLDCCTYNSLLTVTVQQHNKRTPQVFMFQCEETGAEHIKSDLDKVIQNGGEVEPRRGQSDIRSNLENIIGQHVPGSFRQAGPRPLQQERIPPQPDHPPPQWSSREPENFHMSAPRSYTPQEPVPHRDLHELQRGLEVPLSQEQTDTERNTDILNHVLNDLEVFMGKVSIAANTPSLKDSKKDKKNKHKKNKSKKNAVSLPTSEEYISCLQKVKYGFNLLGQLDGKLHSPSAEEFVHIFFTSLGVMLPQYPADVPPTVLSPLLSDAAVQLLSQAVGPEEDRLWRSLGESWNVPWSRWPDDDLPVYIPEFYDGWQPPPPSRMPSPRPYQTAPMSRSNSQRFPPGRPNSQINESQSYSPRGTQQQPEEPLTNSSWRSSPHPSEPVPLYMRVIYDFMARNNQELSIRKGDVVQVIQKSKQWWLVRNSQDEEGNVPQNVLEPMKSSRPMEDLPRDTHGPVTLDLTSTAAQVRAWLEYKGFSKITVRSLGVLSGELLLGMTNTEMRTVCPEEGGRVFFQLQGIKSAIALASEPSGLYNSRY